MDKYLPIGSVVLLKNGRKKIIIYGRKQMHVETGEEWDYLACLYPEGNINEEFMYLFNHDQIDKVYYLGYEDEEEKRFVEENLS
ncbi:DUF4176 domain-containing protein [Clostridium saudiense]|uniref:DUF4176 domain-containing protein n=1 Tax=Clostridium saudiense TaxID=1414720 RepID=UPI0004B2CF33|nr:DUF4176 domain-containing protein [Clostridium saudiense]